MINNINLKTLSNENNTKSQILYIETLIPIFKISNDGLLNFILLSFDTLY